MLCMCYTVDPMARIISIRIPASPEDHSLAVQLADARGIAIAELFRQLLRVEATRRGVTPKVRA